MTDELSSDDVLLMRRNVCQLITDDRLVCEVKWALFSTAACSYKHDSLLKPFPPLAQIGQHRDFAKLQALVRSIDLCKDNFVQCLDNNQIILFHWVLSQDYVSFASITNEQMHKVITDSCLSTVSAVSPDYAFALDYGSRANESFEVRKGQNNSIFSFHGSQLANFYSIIAHGLIGNMNKTSAFGEGTYLSSELSVSLNWSPLAKPGLTRVAFGKRLSCVAICEVITDSKGMKCGTKASLNPSKALAVPEKYLLVRDDSLIKLRYLLVYAEKHNSIDFIPTWTHTARQWANRNRFWFIMIAYFAILMMVGLANSKNLKFYWNRISHYWFTEYGHHHHHYEET